MEKYLLTFNIVAYVAESVVYVLFVASQSDGSAADWQKTACTN